MEAEKKFLLKEGNQIFATFDVSYFPDSVGDWKLIETTDIQQGYLDCDFARVWARDYCRVDVLFSIKDARVRKQGRKLTLAFKSDGGLKRHKVEIPIDESVFDLLWKLSEGRRVIKTRYIYFDGKYEIKINAYKNLPLIVAEVEFLNDKEAESFVPIGKDVTEDPKYKNRNLIA